MNFVLLRINRLEYFCLRFAEAVNLVIIFFPRQVWIKAKFA